MRKPGFLALPSALLIFVGCAGDAIPPSQLKTQSAVRTITPNVVSGQPCVDREDGKVVKVFNVSDMTVTVTDRLEAKHVMTIAAASRRLLPLSEIAHSGWVSKTDGLAAVFSNIRVKALKSWYHLPCTLWRMRDGKPVQVIRTGHEIAIPLLLRDYETNPKIRGLVRSRQASLNAEVDRRRLAIVMTEADLAMDEIRADSELALTHFENHWQDYVAARERSKQVRDEPVYRDLMIQAGIHGEGWYAARADFKGWAQIISIKNVGTDAIWYRQWVLHKNGTWTVTTVEAPPLVFAANYVWCEDVPGHYRIEGSSDEATEITLVHGAPPMVQFARMRDGKIVTGERPDGLGAYWTKSLRMKQLPLPEGLRVKIDERIKNGGVWRSTSAEKAADND